MASLHTQHRVIFKLNTWILIKLNANNIQLEYYSVNVYTG